MTKQEMLDGLRDIPICPKCGDNETTEISITSLDGVWITCWCKESKAWQTPFTQKLEAGLNEP